MSWRDITPDRLVDALLAAGWQVIGERTGAYKRLALVDGDRERFRLLVPLDESAPDYEQMLGAVASSLEGLLFDGRAARLALCRIDPELYR